MVLSELKFFEISSAILSRSVYYLSLIYEVFGKSVQDFLQMIGIQIPDWVLSVIPEELYSWSLLEWCFGSALLIIPGIWLCRWILDTFNPFK